MMYVFRNVWTSNELRVSFIAAVVTGVLPQNGGNHTIQIAFERFP